MVTPVKTFTVIYERDVADWWVADVPEVPGCHTQGHSVEEARARILDALSLYVNDSDQILLREEARLPQSAA